ncbi:MAG: carbon-nitrogen hydrolase family protein [Alphaproteobacteria bacterium]
MSSLRVAACQYPIEEVGSWENYLGKLDYLAGEAEGANLLVFPEYGSMELVSLVSAQARGNLASELEALQEWLPRFLDAHEKMARVRKSYVLAASFPARVADGSYRNQAWLFGPNGTREVQEKLQMTRFEAEIWGVSPGEELRVFDTDFGRIGVAICYDAEFPRLVRAQVEAGADIILVPSCTDGPAGWNRVRLSAQARALENQCFAVQSPTIGDAPWNFAVDRNHGAAAAFGPCDRGFPSDGVIAQGQVNEPGWVFAELDLEALKALRADPQVFNSADWAKAENFLAAPPRLGKV